MASNVLDEFLILFRTRLTGDGIQKVNKQLGHTRNQLFATKNLFKTFFAYDLYGAFSRLIPSLVETTQKLGAMESRFSAVTGQAKTGKEELAWIGEESKRLGLNFLETADNYSIFYATLRNTQGQGATRQIFQQWSEAFRVLHIDPERQGRILYALREMSSKGKIYMSDLAVQLGSAVPDAMQLAAKSMGYFGKQGVQKFRDDIKDGKVNVNEFLKSFSTMVNKTYVNADKLAFAMNKPDAQLQRLATNWQMFQIAFAEAGFEKDLVKLLKTTNKLLSGLNIIAKPLYNILKFTLLLFGASALGRGTKLLAGTINLIGNLAGRTRGLAIAFRLLSRIPILKWLIQGFTKGGWIGGLIVGLGFLLMWILHKFFPNVEKALYNYIDGSLAYIRGELKALASWFETTTLGKSLAGEVKTTGVTEDRASQITNKWNKMFPNYSSLAKLGAMGEGATQIFKSPSQIKQDIKIETTVMLNGSNANPQDIADAISSKQEDNVLQKVGRKAKQMIPFLNR